MPTLEVDDGLRDAVTPIRLRGLEPGSTVTLTADAPDWPTGAMSSTVTFEADADGVVDTETMAPVDGDYEGVRPMGWLWTMRGSGDAPTEPVDGQVTVTIDAHVEDTVVATAEITRRFAAPGVEHVPVSDESLVGDLYLPAGSGVHPGVVVLHGSDGRPDRPTAQLLASHGYAALALQYFGDSDPLPDALSEIPLEYVDTAARWLREQSTVDAGPVGLYGTSKGAELALVAASRYDWVGSIVAIAPTEYRWQALDRPDAAPTGSWTVDGDVLPFVPFRAPPGEDDDGNVVFRAVYENSVDRVDDETLEAARIPVENISAPALLIAGDDDQMWPAARAAESLSDSMPDAECMVFEDAGHGLTPPYVPTADSTGGNGVALGGTPAANAHANADFWPVALDTFERGLETEPVPGRVD